MSSQQACTKRRYYPAGEGLGPPDRVERQLGRPKIGCMRRQQRSIIPDQAERPVASASSAAAASAASGARRTRRHLDAQLEGRAAVRRQVRRRARKDSDGCVHASQHGPGKLEVRGIEVQRHRPPLAGSATQ